MKRISKAICLAFILLLSLIVSTACASSNAEPTEPTESESAEATRPAYLDAPHLEGIELTEEILEVLEYMEYRKVHGDYSVRMTVEIPGTPFVVAKYGEYTVNTFAYESGELVFNVRLINERLGTTNKMGFMVFCDDVPVEFTIPGTTDKLTHISAEIERSQTFKIAFTPTFVSGVGRIDFIQFPAENMNNLGFPFFSYPVMALLPDDYRSPESLHMPV